MKEKKKQQQTNYRDTNISVFQVQVFQLVYSLSQKGLIVLRYSSQVN